MYKKINLFDFLKLLISKFFRQFKPFAQKHFLCITGDAEEVFSRSERYIWHGRHVHDVFITGVIIIWRA